MANIIIMLLAKLVYNQNDVILCDIIGDSNFVNKAVFNILPISKLLESKYTSDVIIYPYVWPIFEEVISPTKLKIGALPVIRSTSNFQRLLVSRVSSRNVSGFLDSRKICVGILGNFPFLAFPIPGKFVGISENCLNDTALHALVLTVSVNL